MGRETEVPQYPLTPANYRIKPSRLGRRLVWGKSLRRPAAIASFYRVVSRLRVARPFAPDVYLPIQGIADMPRPPFLAPVLLALLSAPAAAQAPPRYLIYLHAKIVEETGQRRPTDPAYGVYEYDAILDSLRHAGFIVISDQRPTRTNSDSFATHVARQVDSLLALGVPPEAITIVGFSKGGWIAILASSQLQNPALSFVFMAACGPWAFERPDLHVAGRLLSLYETSDSLGVSCAPLFARRRAGSPTTEIPLSLGLGHGTFFQPRAAWLEPVLTWANLHTP